MVVDFPAGSVSRAQRVSHRQCQQADSGLEEGQLSRKRKRSGPRPRRPVRAPVPADDGPDARAATGTAGPVVLVSDDDIRGAQARLWSEARVVAEPGGAAAFAALASGKYRPAKGERVAVLVCGANTDAVRFG